jgi:hypothetical protein
MPTDTLTQDLLRNVQWVSTDNLVGARYDDLTCDVCDQDTREGGRMLRLTKGNETFICVPCVGLIGAVATSSAAEFHLRYESKLLGSFIGGFCTECGRAMDRDECGDEEPEVRVCNQCAGIPPDED